MRIWIKVLFVIIFIFMFIYVFFANINNSNNISTESTTSIRDTNKLINDERDFEVAEQILKTTLDKRLNEGLSDCSNEVAELKLRIASAQLRNYSNDTGALFSEIFNTKCYNKDIRARAMLYLGWHVFSAVVISENRIPKFNKEVFSKNRLGEFFGTNGDLVTSGDVYFILQRGFDFSIKNIERRDEILLAKSFRNTAERYERISSNFKYNSPTADINTKSIYDNLFKENEKITKEINNFISSQDILYTDFLAKAYSHSVRSYDFNSVVKESEEVFKKYENVFKDYIIYTDKVDINSPREISQNSVTRSNIIFRHIVKLIIKSDFDISNKQNKEIQEYLDKYIYTMHENDKKRRFIVNSIGDHRDFDKTSKEYNFYKAHIYIATQIDPNYKIYLLEDIQDNLSGIEGWVESDFLLEF